MNDRKAARRQLEEMQRHNRALEGRGLYVASYVVVVRNKEKEEGQNTRHTIRNHHQFPIVKISEKNANTLFQRRVHAQRFTEKDR